MRNLFIRTISTTAGAVALALAAVGSYNSVFAQTIEIMPPANDNFDSAEPIEGPSGFLPGTNINASVEPGEVTFYKGGQSVWYRWMAPANVSMTFDVKSIDTAAIGIAVFNGDRLEKLFPMGHGSHFDRVTFIAQVKNEYSIQITSKAEDGAGNFELSWAINGAETWKQFNYDGPLAPMGEPATGKSDFAIFRWDTSDHPAGMWWIWMGNTQTSAVYNFGDNNARVEHFVPGDYDGDGMVDIALFDHQTHMFWILQSSTQTGRAVGWGFNNDWPIHGDFDGDDMADVSIWRPSTGTFWILKSSDGQAMAVRWGMDGDKPVCADYDGDGITDFAVRRGNNNERAVFYLLRSSDQQVVTSGWGFGDDMTVPGDYDGDGKGDIAVFRPSNSGFYYLKSSDGTDVGVMLNIPFINGDRAVPGDYFGNQTSDICIWQHEVGNFRCLADGGYGAITTFHFGLTGDEPVASSNVH